jgi:hypothetical protein
MQNISSQQRRGTYITHSNGANALLHMRSIEQYYSNPVSARLYEVAYAQMVNPQIFQAHQHAANILATAAW